ncbi:F-box/kelch-repeat protein, partial [Mucuna pruriens]
MEKQVTTNERVDIYVPEDLVFSILSKLPEENDYYIYMLDSGSVNGIICLCQGFKKVMLWNPTNGKFKVIPPSPVEFPSEGAMVLFYGFGYDHVRNDYKLIRSIEIVALTANDLEVEDKSMLHYETLWEIYSLQSNSWRKLDVDMSGYYASGVTSQVYLDGVCHWWDESEIPHHDKACLVSFDMSNERQLTVLNESIALISNYAEISTFQVSILGEVGVKESWIKLFIVGPLSYVDHPIGVGKKSIFFIKEDEQLAWFDLNTQKIEELGIKGRRFCSQIKFMTLLETIVDHCSYTQSVFYPEEKIREELVVFNGDGVRIVVDGVFDFPMLGLYAKCGSLKKEERQFKKMSMRGVFVLEHFVVKRLNLIDHPK